MKKSSLRNVIISISLAVVIGVVFFSVNSAFGVPTVNPPGNGVSPTFTGLNVTGDVTNPLEGGGAGVPPRFNNPLKINDSVTITGLLDSAGLTVQGDSVMKGYLRIDELQPTIDNAEKIINVTSDLSVSGVLSATRIGTHYVSESLNEVTIASNDSEQVSATCGSGEVVTGCGYSVFPGANNQEDGKGVFASFQKPGGQDSGLVGRCYGNFTNTNAYSVRVKVWGICFNSEIL